MSNLRSSLDLALLRAPQWRRWLVDKRSGGLWRTALAEVSARIDLGLRAVAHVEYLDEEEETFENYLGNMAAQMQMKAEELYDALKQSGRLIDVRADIAKEAALQWVFDRVDLLDEEGNRVDSSILEVKEPDIPDMTSKISENDDVSADDLSEDDLMDDQIVDQENNDGDD